MHALTKNERGSERRAIAAARRRGRLTLLGEATVEDPGTRLALATGRRLGVVYQPIVVHEQRCDGSCRWRVQGVEALVRAESPRGLTVRPDQLLPAVERAGLLSTLFDFVLTETLAAAGGWHEEGLGPLGVAVNLHVGGLLDEGLADTVARRLEAAQVAPELLTLEISESAPLSDLKRAARILRRVRALGVRVALDDFGAGFSTATRLDWLVCDELKIDRALVHGVESSDEQRCIVEHLIALAHAHGLDALAEGVETEAALELLCELGCDRAQGYLFARPVPAALLGTHAREWHARDAQGSRASRQLSLPGFARAGTWPEEALDAIA
ncbi:MAG: EAL domain-containing protein [Proteobacteria bacterium]|nr:EAL domain-containing protein [Pseudomonadota bacterium]